jgi:hypothetical protein
MQKRSRRDDVSGHRCILAGHAAKEPLVIQAIYKGVEIEMEMHQQAHEQWKCDYTLIKHPERTMTIHHGTETFPTLETAREHALKDAQDAIDLRLS